MSLNIPEQYLKVTSKVEMTVDLSLLGPRQYSAFKRVLQSGIIFGGSYRHAVPAFCAVSLRLAAKLPILHFGARHVMWENVYDNEDFFNRLVACAVARQLEPSFEETSAWDKNYLLKFMDHAQNKVASREPFYAGSISVASARRVFKGFEFCKYPHEVGGTITINAKEVL